MEEKINDKLQSIARLKQKSEALNSFAKLIEQIPNYITKAPAPQVNNNLRRIINKITITESKTVIEFN